MENNHETKQQLQEKTKKKHIHLKIYNLSYEAFNSFQFTLLQRLFAMLLYLNDCVKSSIEPLKDVRIFFIRTTPQKYQTKNTKIYLFLRSFVFFLSFRPFLLSVAVAGGGYGKSFVRRASYAHVQYTSENHATKSIRKMRSEIRWVEWMTVFECVCCVCSKECYIYALDWLALYARNIRGTISIQSLFLEYRSCM